ncbi:MAG TPA: hypothetical protein V6D25_07105 [Leptolyngbyaceae cyanobacterium]
MWYPAGTTSSNDCAHQPGVGGDEGELLTNDCTDAINRVSTYQ